MADAYLLVSVLPGTSKQIVTEVVWYGIFFCREEIGTVHPLNGDPKYIP